MLVADGRYSAIIDWDDAGWSDPVVDLRYVPLRVADKVLEGYRAVMPLDGDDSAEERLVWDKLTGALLRFGRCHGLRARSSQVPRQGRSSSCSLRRRRGLSHNVSARAMTGLRLTTARLDRATRAGARLALNGAAC